MKIIQIYPSTIEYKNEKVKDFYRNIKIALRNNNCYYIIFMADFNAKMGKQMNRTEIVIGKFCLDGRNKRDEILINFLHSYNLYLINSFFQKKPHKRWT